MVYTVTLADGSELVWSTRDRDAPAVASSSYNNASLLDTFTGNSTLFTHVGERGSDWASVNEETRLDRFDVANGSVTPQAFELDGVLYPSWTPQSDTSDLFYGANLSLEEGGQIDLTVYGPSDYATLSAFVDTTGNATQRVFVWMRAQGSNSALDSSPIETAVIPGEDFTTEFRLTGNRADIDMFVNGVSVYSGSLDPGDAVHDAGSAAASIANTNGVLRSPVVHELSGGPL